jgi:hypothetical protein
LLYIQWIDSVTVEEKRRGGKEEEKWRMEIVRDKINPRDTWIR